MALPDITSNLELHYKCDDEPDSSIIKDSGLKGHDLTIVQDLSIDGGRAFPVRVNADGRKAWQFSRVKTSGANSIPTHYAAKTITDVQMDALVGSGNGHNGEHTVAAWVRRAPSGVGEGTGRDVVISIGGRSTFADTLQNRATATCIRLARTSPVKYSTFYNKAPNTSNTFTPAFVVPPELDDRWTHVAFVLRADVAGTSCFIDFYKNGVLTESTASLAGSFAFTGALPASAEISIGLNRVGTDTDNIGQIGGAVRNVMLFSRALVAADVAALFASTLVAPPRSFDLALP